MTWFPLAVKKDVQQLQMNTTPPQLFHGGLPLACCCVAASIREDRDRLGFIGGCLLAGTVQATTALQKQRQSSKPAAACRWKSTVCNRFRVIVKRDQGDYKDYKKNDYVLTSGNRSARGFQQDVGDGFSRGLSYSFMQSSWRRTSLQQVGRQGNQ